MKKILIVGAFDILHPGHITVIKEAKELGDWLTIIIARDQNILKLKGHQPYFSEKIRLKNLKKLKLADKVVLGDLENKLKVIKEESPQIIALGYDQYPAKELVDGIKQLGIKIVRLSPFKKEIFKSSKIRKILEDKMTGFLNINKPSALTSAFVKASVDQKDWTSHDVIAKLRSITGIKQIGHAGTLDPLATGVLVCGIGKATQLLDAFHLLPKTYQATIKLGLVSDTYDRTGQISSSQFPISNKFLISKSQIQNTLKTFIGKQKQLPPMYSAKKVKGKKLYELARRGKIVKRNASEIVIYDIKLIKFITNNPLPVFDIQVTCSTGTYIRTLVHDIGQRLKTGAILEKLKRTAIGDFNIKKAVQLKKVNKDNWQKFIVKPRLILESLIDELKRNNKF